MEAYIIALAAALLVCAYEIWRANRTIAKLLQGMTVLAREHNNIGESVVNVTRLVAELNGGSLVEMRDGGYRINADEGTPLSKAIERVAKKAA